MNKPILALQYADPKHGRFVAIATTKNYAMLLTFKRTVLEEARQSYEDRRNDEVIRLHEKLELERLEKVLNLIIPDDEIKIGGTK